MEAKEKFNTRKMIINLCIAAVLGALGTIIMLVGTYLSYPLAPWLKLEPSDTVILVTYVLCGWQYSIVCAVIKAVVNILILGPVGPIAIGQITAIITSLVYVASLCLCQLFAKKFEHKIVYRIVSYVIITLIVSVVLTLCNYLFITPTYMSQKPDSCFNPAFSGTVQLGANFKGSLFWVCFSLYLPFNIIKGIIVCVLFELLYLTVIKYFRKVMSAMIAPSNVVVEVKDDSDLVNIIEEENVKSESDEQNSTVKN